MRRLLICLFAAFVSPIPSFAADIQCTGIDDGPAIQASLDAGGITRLIGDCVSLQSLTIDHGGLLPVERATELTGGLLRYPTLLVYNSRNVRIKNIELMAQGAGVTIEDSILVRFENIYLDSPGDGIVLNSIAGVWITNSHINGHEGNGTYGIRVGDSPDGFEAVWLSNTLIETHDGGVRIGGAGNVLNVTLDNLYTDRTQWFSVLINPASTASVRNVQINGLWANGDQYSVAMNSTETTGEIDNIIINGAILLGLQNPVVWGVADWTANQIMTGPQQLP